MVTTPSTRVAVCWTPIVHPWTRLPAGVRSSSCTFVTPLVKNTSATKLGLMVEPESGLAMLGCPGVGIGVGVGAGVGVGVGAGTDALLTITVTGCASSVLPY